jgi:predicted DNA-binding WGR domain protein
MQRFEMAEGTSDKFWEVEVSDCNLTVRFGRVGTNGQTKTKEFADKDAAIKERDKLIREKTGKGYKEATVGAGASLAPVPVAVSAPATPVPAPASAPASDNSIAVAESAAQPKAPRAPATGPIVWPQGGFQWSAKWRDKLPVVRGIHAPPLTLDPRLENEAPRFHKQRYNDPEPTVVATSKALGHSWHAWNEAQAEILITPAKMAIADVEYWQQLLVQEMSLSFNYNDEHWAVRMLLLKHAPGFAMDVILPLWDATIASNNWAVRYHVQGQYMGLLRAAIACADETQYQAAQANAESWRERGARMTMGCAYLFPHIESWTVDCLGRGDGHTLLATCSMPLAWGLKVLPNQVYDVDQYQPQILLQLHLHGENAFPILKTMLSRCQRGEDFNGVLRLLADMHLPQTLDTLLTHVEPREVRVALDKLTERFPAAALLTAVEQMRGKETRAIETWAVQLALRLPEAAQTAMAAMPQETASMFQSLLAGYHRPEASAQDLPELLTNPPWNRKRKPVELPTLELSPQATADSFNWSEAERTRHLAFDPHWMRRGVQKGPDCDKLMLRNLRVRESSIPDLMQGRAMRDDDIGGVDQFNYQRAYFIFLLSPDLRLNFWNHCNWNGIKPYSVDPVMAILAAHGGAALPGLATLAQVAPEMALQAAENIDCSVIVPTVMHAACNLKKARPLALNWMRTHPRTAAVHGLPMAFGKDKSARTNAQYSMRWMVNNGLDETVHAVAAEYGADMQAALQALLELDPLDLAPLRPPKLPTFFVPAAMRRPELKTGLALPSSAIEHIGTMLAFSKIEAPYAGLEVVRELCTAASLADFSWDLFQAWMDVGAPSKENWAFQALGVFGNDATAHRLAPKIREWPGESAHQRAVTGLDLLAAIGSDVALMHLNGIAAKAKFKGLQERAREKIAAVAEMRGFTTEELADRLVPDLGLDEAGALQLDFGPRQFTVAFDEVLKPFVKDAQGVRLKDLPKPIKSDDADKASAATERYKQLKKDAKAVASLQLMRLEMSMVAQRRWNADNFRMFFLDHPVMRTLAARLVWATYTDGQATQLFRIAEDWTLADRDDTLFELPANATVGIAHLLEMPEAARDAFGQIFADYEILQPFKQLGRETYALSDAEKAATTLTRFKDKTVATASMMGLINRGWERGEAQDAGWVGWFSKYLDGGLQVDVTMDPGTVVGDMSYEPKQKLPELTLRKARTWDSSDLLTFANLGPIAASEILRDIELLAKV